MIALKTPVITVSSCIDPIIVIKERQQDANKRQGERNEGLARTKA